MSFSARNLLRLVAAGAAVTIAAVTLVACSPAGDVQSKVAPMRDQIVANLHEYPGVTVQGNVTYETYQGTQLKLDVCMPPTKGTATPSPRPALIEVHGGSWAFDDKADPDWRDVCEWLASNGYVVMNVDYSLAPVHPYPAAIHEVEHAVEWMRESAQVKRYSINPKLIGAFGGSAGGNLVSELATVGKGPLDTGHRVAAVAEMSGPINLTASGPERTDFYKHVLAYLGCANFTDCPQAAAASPINHIDASDPPFFVSHSTDELIPLAQSTAFVKRLQLAGIDVTFVTLKGHLHSIAGLNFVMRRRIIAFFNAHLVADPISTTSTN